MAVATVAAWFGLTTDEDLAGHRAMLVSFARRLGAPADIADDLAQDTLVQLLLRGDQLREPAAIGAWLRTTAARMWADRCRRAPQLSSLEGL